MIVSNTDLYPSGPKIDAGFGKKLCADIEEAADRILKEAGIEEGYPVYIIVDGRILEDEIEDVILHYDRYGCDFGFGTKNECLSVDFEDLGTSVFLDKTQAEDRYQEMLEKEKRTRTAAELLDYDLSYTQQCGKLKVTIDGYTLRDYLEDICFDLKDGRPYDKLPLSEVNEMLVKDGFPAIPYDAKTDELEEEREL